MVAKSKQRATTSVLVGRVYVLQNTFFYKVNRETKNAVVCRKAKHLVLSHYQVLKRDYGVGKKSQRLYYAADLPISFFD